MSIVTGQMQLRYNQAVAEIDKTQFEHTTRRERTQINTPKAAKLEREIDSHARDACRGCNKNCSSHASRDRARQRQLEQLEEEKSCGSGTKTLSKEAGNRRPKSGTSQLSQLSH